jgi:hypothetical protein
MQREPVPPVSAEEIPEEPPIKHTSCEIILFPGFDISVIVQAPQLWDRLAKPRAESSTRPKAKASN